MSPKQEFRLGCAAEGAYNTVNAACPNDPNEGARARSQLLTALVFKNELCACLFFPVFISMSS